MCACVQLLICVRLFATAQTVARQAALSMGFSRQDYWSELPFPSLGDLSDSGIEPEPPVSPWQGDSLPLHLLGQLMWAGYS